VVLINIKIVTEQVLQELQRRELAAMPKLKLFTDWQLCQNPKPCSCLGGLTVVREGFCFPSLIRLIRASNYHPQGKSLARNRGGTVTQHGHALAAYTIPGSTPIQPVTVSCGRIVPRYQASIMHSVPNGALTDIPLTTQPIYTAAVSLPINHVKMR
jgi:hypothetical protein